MAAGWPAKRRPEHPDLTDLSIVAVLQELGHLDLQALRGKASPSTAPTAARQARLKFERLQGAEVRDQSFTVRPTGSKDQSPREHLFMC